MQNSIRKFQISALLPLIYEVRIRCSRSRSRNRRRPSQTPLQRNVDAGTRLSGSDKEANVRAWLSLAIINCYGLCSALLSISFHLLLSHTATHTHTLSLCLHNISYACRLLTTSAVKFVSAFYSFSLHFFSFLLLRRFEYLSSLPQSVNIACSLSLLPTD